MIGFSRTERQTPYTGSDFDEFSKSMYEFRRYANDGFVFTDIDGIVKNHKKKTIAILEVKTRCGQLTYAQQRTFNELHEFLKRGVYDGWTYLGFYVLQFENTSFRDGRALLNGQIVSNKEFMFWLKLNF